MILPFGAHILSEWLLVRGRDFHCQASLFPSLMLMRQRDDLAACTSDRPAFRLRSTAARRHRLLHHDRDLTCMFLFTWERKGGTHSYTRLSVEPHVNQTLAPAAGR